jgi:hypothetical protein
MTTPCRDVHRLFPVVGDEDRRRVRLVAAAQPAVACANASVQSLNGSSRTAPADRVNSSERFRRRCPPESAMAIAEADELHELSSSSTRARIWPSAAS